MIDYTDRLQQRASCLDYILSPMQLDYLNQYVNEKIYHSVCESDALDYAYFYIKLNYVK